MSTPHTPDPMQQPPRTTYNGGPFTFRADTGIDVARFCSAAAPRDELFCITTVRGDDRFPDRTCEIGTTLNEETRLEIARTTGDSEAIAQTLRPGRLPDVEHELRRPQASRK